MAKSKKKSKLLTIVIIILILCFPIAYQYKDGGTVSYKAVLYTYTKYHRLETDGTYFEETEFLFFPFNFIKGY